MTESLLPSRRRRCPEAPHLVRILHQLPHQIPSLSPGVAALLRCGVLPSMAQCGDSTSYVDAGLVVTSIAVPLGALELLYRADAVSTPPTAQARSPPLPGARHQQHSDRIVPRTAARHRLVTMPTWKWKSPRTTETQVMLAMAAGATSSFMFTIPMEYEQIDPFLPNRRYFPGHRHRRQFDLWSGRLDRGYFRRAPQPAG